MGEAIVITSGKGGVGKTTTSANIGTALALLGKKVCLVDTDIGLRNLDVVMGLENRIIYDLCDVADGRCRLNQALVKDKRFEQLYMLPAAQTRDKNSVSPEQVKDIILELKKILSTLLLIARPGLNRDSKMRLPAQTRLSLLRRPRMLPFAMQTGSSDCSKVPMYNHRSLW